MHLNTLDNKMIEYNENQYYDIKEKFIFKGHTYESELNFAYLNGELDKIFSKYSLPYDESYIMIEPLNDKNLKKYMNRVVRELLYDNNIDVDISREVIYDIVNLLDHIVFLLDRGSKTSLDMSLISIAQAAIKDPKIEEFLFRDSYNEDMTADEIFDIRLKETEEMSKLDIPSISTMLRAGTGVKSNQMYNIFKGLTFRTRVNKVDEIYPTLLKDRWIDGLSNLKNLYIESNIARKSMLMNKQNIADSGTHNRKSSILAQDTRITEEDCGTKYYQSYFVKDEKMLKALEFKYRVTEDGNLKVIRTTDTELIGTEVKVRSVLRCCAKHGGVCATCFGEHAKWNMSTDSYSMDVGVEFAKAINAAISQLVLSFKHNASPYLKPSQITVVSVETGEILDNAKFMTRKFNMLNILNDYEVFFYMKDVYRNSRGEFKMVDNEFDDNDIIRVKEFHLVDRKSGEEFILYDGNDVHLKVQGEQFNRFTLPTTNYSDDIKIYLQKDDVITHILINAHSTMKYKEIIELYNIDTSKIKLEDGEDDIDYFMRRVLESSFYGENITSLEVIFKNKIKDIDSPNGSQAPDWKSDNPQYKILSLEKVINRQRSLSTRIPVYKVPSMIIDPFYHNPKNLIPSAYDMLFEDKYAQYEEDEIEEDAY